MWAALLADVGIDWVLDWNRIANLIVVLLPFFLAVGAGFKFLIDRADRRAKEQREEETERQRKQDEERDARRTAEMQEMQDSRQAFYADILTEAKRMRQLYEAELDRGISLRTSLAEAARREMLLQETISALNDKVDRLQSEVADLRRELENTRRQALEMNRASAA